MEVIDNMVKPERLAIIENKHGNTVEYVLDKGDILIEQTSKLLGVINFNSWGCEAYLDSSTVAVFRITKLK